MSDFRKGSHKREEYFGSQHRFEHWYRDNFWVDSGHQNYFDGCIRDELQCRRAFRYTLTQCRRHGFCADPADYPHTHLNVDIDRAVRRALQLRAFLNDVPYKRYQQRRARH